MGKKTGGDKDEVDLSEIGLTDDERDEALDIVDELRREREAEEAKKATGKKPKAKKPKKK